MTDSRIEPRQPGRKLLPYREARHELGGICAPTLYKMMERGDIEKVRIGKRCFITAASVDRFIENQLAAQAQSAGGVAGDRSDLPEGVEVWPRPDCSGREVTL